MLGPVIICEHSGEWAAAWRQTVGRGGTPARRGLRVVAVRSVGDCLDESARHSAAFVIAQWSLANTLKIWSLLERLPLGMTNVCCALAAERRLAAYQWSAREAGAVHVIFSPRRMRDLVELAGRHLSAHPLVLERDEDRIWATLPWTRGS